MFRSLTTDIPVQKYDSKDLPVEVLNFDKLCDSFRVHSSTVKLILGIRSNTTLWRRRKEAGFPKPDKFNTYSVRDVRCYLSGANTTQKEQL